MSEYPDVGDLSVVESLPGHFAPVRVCEDNLCRWIEVGAANQGKVLRIPAADDVDASLEDGPGPVTGSSFALGWLAAASLAPEGRMAMAGLGSGVGPVTLLHHFPRLKLHVFEVDPVVIELALRHFPLLAHYQRSGRLELIAVDARAGFDAVDDAFDLAFIDAYDADTEMVFRDAEFYRCVARAARAVAINYVGVVNSEAMGELLRALFASEVPPVAMAAAQPATALAQLDLSQAQNWICLSQLPELQAMSALRPYADLALPARLATLLRASYDVIVAQLEAHRQQPASAETVSASAG